jgi:hypothetical protein
VVLNDWRARGYLPKCLTSALVVPVCKKAFKRSFYFFTQFNVSSAGAGIQKAGPAHNAVSAHRGLPWRCPHSSKAAGGGQNRQVGIYHCSRLGCSWIQSPAAKLFGSTKKTLSIFFGTAKSLYQSRLFRARSIQEILLQNPAHVIRQTFAAVPLLVFIGNDVCAARSSEAHGRLFRVLWFKAWLCQGHFLNTLREPKFMSEMVLLCIRRKKPGTCEALWFTLWTYNGAVLNEFRKQWWLGEDDLCSGTPWQLVIYDVAMARELL